MTRMEITMYFQLALIAAIPISFIVAMIHYARNTPEAKEKRERKKAKKEYKDNLKLIKNDAINLGISESIVNSIKNISSIKFLIKAMILGQNPDEIALCIKNCHVDNEEHLNKIYQELLKTFGLKISRNDILKATDIDICNLDEYLPNTKAGKEYFLIDLLRKKTFNAKEKKYTKEDTINELKIIYARISGIAEHYNIVSDYPGYGGVTAHPYLYTTVNFLKDKCPKLLEHPFIKCVTTYDTNLLSQLTYIIEEFGADNQIITTITSEMNKLIKKKGEYDVKCDLGTIYQDHRDIVSETEAKVLETLRHGLELGIDLTQEWKEYSYLAAPTIKKGWSDSPAFYKSNAIVFEKRLEEEKQKLRAIKKNEDAIDTTNLKIKDPNKKFILIEED